MVNQLEDVVGLIEEWGAEKGLHDVPGAQLEKLMEEMGELVRAHGELGYLKGCGNRPGDACYDKVLEELKDAIGDCGVVLVQYAAGQDMTLGDCLRHAWGEISDRKGKTIDGIFYKEEDLE